MVDEKTGRNIPYQMQKNAGIHAGWAVLDDLLRLGVTKWSIAKDMGCTWSQVRKWQLRASAPNYFNYQKLMTLLAKTKADLEHAEEMRRRFDIS